MLVKFGLVVVGIGLLLLLLLGIGLGSGFVRLGSDRELVFGRAPEASSNDPTPSESKTVSADDLLKKKGVAFESPATESPVAPAPPTGMTALTSASSTPATTMAAVPSSPAAEAGMPHPPSPNALAAHALPDRLIASTAPMAAKPSNAPMAASNAPMAAKPSNAIQPPAKVGVIRVLAAGGEAMVDPDGNRWEPASGFDDGTFAWMPGGKVDNARFQGIYRQERYAMTRWRRQVPNGNYTVLLRFAETYEGIKAAGDRIFSVQIQDQTIDNIDIYKEAGGRRRELVKSADVTVTDGLLTILFKRIEENPKINGIEIIPR